MTHRLGSLILCLLLAPALQAAPSITADTGWQRSTVSNGNVQRRVQTVFFDDAAVGAGNTLAISLSSDSAVLERVIMQTTVCTDCDLFIRTGSSAGFAIVFARDDYAADTIENVAFTQYGNDIANSGCAASSVTAILDNNDGVTRDVTVTLVWRAE